MVNKNNILEYMLQSSYHPLSYDDLMEVFEIPDDEEYKFASILGKMEKQGEVVKTRKNKYGIPEMMNLAKGVITLSGRGYGFLLPDQADHPDIFVYGKNINGAMHNDKVMVRIYQQGDGDDRRLQIAERREGHEDDDGR